MTRLIACLIFFPNLMSNSFAQSHKATLEQSEVPSIYRHYQEEFTFDSTRNPNAWLKTEKGLQVSFVSTDQSYFRTEVPEIKNKTNSIELVGWKGERLSTNILVWARDTVQQINFTTVEFTNAAGNKLNNDAISLKLVRYVISDYPYSSDTVGCGPSPYKQAFLMPDRLENIERFDVPAKSVRSVWVAVDIPASAIQGIYTGNIFVHTGTDSTKLTLSIKVQNQVLPIPHDWKHRLDLWQNPWAVSWYNNIEPWSDEHLVLLKQHLKLYADAGGKFITTYAVHSPWADNSYLAEGGMIEWVKQKNGNWKFDYKIFDQYVQLCLDLGIDDAITIYTPVPWETRFRYLNEANGKYLYEKWAPSSDTFSLNWNIFLTDLKSHLQKKGWLEKSYLGINENPLQQTLDAIKVIRKHSADWKITYAGHWHTELKELLNDYCLYVDLATSVENVKERSAKGFTTTWYVACTPAHPNNFVFSPPVEGRWMGWYTTAHGYDGFLRWAYDAWTADPLRDARHFVFPAGDCFMMYPGGNSSVRFEKMREGIVDFEKIGILREKTETLANKDIKALMAKLDGHLKVFLTEKDFDAAKITADVEKGKSLLNEISEKIATTKTSVQ